MILQGSRVIARLSNFSSQCLDKRLSLAWNISRVSTQHRPCPEGHGAICTFKPTLSTSLPYRPYATNATNAVSRPKAHTGRTTSAPRKKAATTKALTSGSTAAGTEPAAKKPAAKKPAAKKPTAKKKARRGPKKSKSRTRAKSTKAPKKPAKAKKSKLTPEQEKEQKRRSEIKNLKAKALTPPKGLPSTAYIVFNTEKYKNTRTRIDQGAAKECSAQYRSFSPEEREHYNHIANQNKATNAARYRDWIRSFTPTQIREANNARQMLRRKTKGRHWAKLVDERLVKGLRTQYNQFYTERYKSGDYKGMNVGEAGKLIGAEWRALSASEKKPYAQRAEEDLARYQQEVKAVYNRDVAHAAAKAA